MITENFINTRKSARYYILGDSSNKINTVWFVFHGYGQLAKDFIKIFEVIKNKNTIVIAPEASNKFYLRGFNGKIGATWMTKEDRENEIEDYVTMINNIYREISKQIDLKNTKINVLGFSQGTHTAVRWLHKTKTKIKNLLLWSGTFPHDCNYKETFDYWSHINSIIILGTKDRLIGKNMINEEKKYLSNQKIKINFLTYENEHAIDTKRLVSITNTL